MTQVAHLGDWHACLLVIFIFSQAKLSMLLERGSAIVWEQLCSPSDSLQSTPEPPEPLGLCWHIHTREQFCQAVLPLGGQGCDDEEGLNAHRHALRVVQFALASLQAAQLLAQLLQALLKTMRWHLLGLSAHRPAHASAPWHCSAASCRQTCPPGD